MSARGQPHRSRTTAPAADMVSAIARQARADGLPIAGADARGLAQLMQHLGFDAPGLVPAGPVMARLLAEILVLTGAPSQPPPRPKSTGPTDEITGKSAL